MNNTTTSSTSSFFDTKVLGHPAGLFVLFFTEMWERFSFYGMRVLLINFLTMAAIGSNPGWGWSTANAGALFGTYAGLLYLTPIAGGIIADKFTGFRYAILIGAIIMTLGHVSMAFETEFSLYLGLGLLVVGTGFFKPNMTSIISNMYKDLPQKKDGAFTIFYMGVNAGAFFGMMLCGYVAEKMGWSYGFGLAGIFMLLGCLQFMLSKKLFGDIGAPPSKIKKQQEANLAQTATTQDAPKEKLNPFTLTDKILIVITSVIGLLYLINDPVSKIGHINLLPKNFLGNPFNLSGDITILLIGFALFLVLVIGRIIRYEKVIRDRMITVIIFAVFIIFFMMSFEQGATSLVIFARDYTDRVLTGNAATIFNVVNTLLTIVPLAIISYVLILLFKKTFKKIALANTILGISFVCIWGIVAWMLHKDFNTHSFEVEYSAYQTEKLDGENKIVKDEKGNILYQWIPLADGSIAPEGKLVEIKKTNVASTQALTPKQPIAVHFEKGKAILLDAQTKAKISEDYTKAGEANQIVTATVIQPSSNEVEITTSWFSILNAFFIIAFASLVSKLWESKYNPSAAKKYAMGLTLLGIGFGILAFGAYAIPKGGEPGLIKVSIVWLISAYFFHTLAELCMSPVGLSYVSKLVPARMIAFMFGMWYLAIAIGNKLAGTLGGMIEIIQKEESMSYFFGIFTVVPIAAGCVIWLLNPVIKKLMHGIK